MNTDMPRSRVEWITTIFGLISILVVLIYCGWRIQVQDKNWAGFHEYAEPRDRRWNDILNRVEANQHAILKRLEAKP